MLRGILYIRVSDPKQVGGTSLDTQERQGIEWFKANNVELAKIFREEGQSGEQLDRDEFQKALEYCSDKKNDISIFAVPKINRFSRDIENHYHVKWILRQLNVQFVSITEQIPTDEGGSLMEAMYAAAAEFENKRRRRITMEGSEVRLNEGRQVYNLPLGYIRDKMWEGDGVRPAIKDPDRWDLIKMAWDMYVSCQYTNEEIREKINTLGLRTLKGTPIPKSTVSRLFSNPFYAGIIEVRGKHIQVRKKGTHPVCVSEDDFYYMLGLANEKTKTRGQKFYKINPNFPLNRLLHCEGCSYYLSGGFSKGKGGNYFGYYSCRKKTCPNRSNISKEVAEKSFVEILNSMKPDPDFVKLVQMAIDKKIKPHYEKVKTEREQADKRLAQLNIKLDRVRDGYEEGLYSLSECKERETKVRIEIANLRNNMVEITEDNIKYMDIVEEGAKILEHLHELWITLSPVKKRKLHEFLFPDGIVLKNGMLEHRQYSSIYSMIEAIEGTQVQDGVAGGLKLEHLDKFIQWFKTLKTLTQVNLQGSV